MLLGIIGGVTFHLSRRLKETNARYTQLIQGVDGDKLEDIWLGRAQQVTDHEDRLTQLEQLSRQIQRASIQHVGLIRFNPFEDVGGDQSFALALLDGEQNGVVVSSIYSRSGGRMYAKPIQAGAQTRVLSEEEEMAIALALNAATPVLSNHT